MVHGATSRAAFAAALAAATALGGCMSTANYGTGESPEVAIFREMTGGMLSPKKEPVVHKPRAPLVLPPSAGQLPPPAPAAEVASAQWPDDPDKRAKAARVYSDKPGEVTPDDYRRLKPLAAAARGRAGAGTPNAAPTSAVATHQKQREAFESALNNANGFSTERRYLTEPPETVREPAPTAPQEFEEISKKKKGNALTRLFRRG